MAYARRTDETQTEIVIALRQLGFSVAITSRLGDGFPDVAIAKNVNGNRRTWLAEIKNGFLGYKLTKRQRSFHADWKGEILIFDSVDSVIAWEKRLRKV